MWMTLLELAVAITSLMCNLVTLWQVRKLLLKGAKEIENDILKDTPKKP